MKKMMLVLVLSAVAILFASNPKLVIFGMLDRNGNEFTNENISGVTFKAWLQQGTGPYVDFTIITQADSLAQCGVAMYPDPVEYPLRGVSMVDLQHFPAWGVGNILHIEMIDWNEDSEGHCRIDAQYIILDTDLGAVELGFEDLGLVGSGMPFQFSFISGGGDIKTFVYPCVTTAGTDYNFIGLPVETGWTKGSDFDPTGENIETVSRSDAAAQMAETGVYSSVFGWCKDIPVQTGGVYSISAKNNFDFTVIGDSVNVVNNLIITSGTDYNHIVHPLTKAGLTTSAMLGNDIGIANCNAISKWNAETQAFTTSNYVLTQWMNSFSISTGQPLLVNMKTNYTWPTGKVYDGDIIEDVSNISEKNAKGGTAKARLVFFHLVNDSGSELTDDEMRLIQFDAFITARPTDILDENSYDCGFMRINGMSVMYVNIGNFSTPWTTGEILNINSVNFPPMEGFGLSLNIDNSSSTIYKGFEDQIPGSGIPWTVDMDQIIPLTGVDVAIREESGNIVLEWGWAGEDVTGYNIYASDDPYGTFSYVTTTSNLSWSTAGSENKKFFYVVSTNAKSSVPPKTIDVKEKK